MTKAKVPSDKIIKKYLDSLYIEIRFSAITLNLFLTSLVHYLNFVSKAHQPLFN